jgi:hypothetical protein
VFDSDGNGHGIIVRTKVVGDHRAVHLLVVVADDGVSLVAIEIVEVVVAAVLLQVSATSVLVFSLISSTRRTSGWSECPSP